MTRRVVLAVCLTVLAARPAVVLAASAVFNGDPTNPANGTPYEILPGKPLVLPGADGVLGTVDDVVTPAIVGDIDLVVRVGNPSGASIPAPALGGVLPHGIAGPRSAGGREIPFTVFLSDGAVSTTSPAGRPLAAADMNGLPVIVAAFADLDGDGIIGPTLHDTGGAADLALELRELEPVGRTAALFSNGIARGSLAVRRARPASQGGLRIALAAMALTGPLDPNFFDGAIPSGPAIATALPFLPQRDLNRLIRDRAVPAGPESTLQQLIQFAALPAPDAYALRLDGSEPSIDGAIIESQPAVRVSLRDGDVASTVDLAVDHLLLGSRRLTAARVRVVPVDRFDNPADPPADFSVQVSADGPLRMVAPRAVRYGLPLPLRHAIGARVGGRIAGNGSGGTIRIERDGIVLAALPYTVDAAADRVRADLTLGSDAAPTLQAALDGVSDVNHDGRLVVALRAGLYPTALHLARAIELVGAGSARTVLVGDDRAAVVSADAAGVVIRGITAAGGAPGFALAGQGAQLIDSAAWHNAGDGVVLSARSSAVRQSAARGNGGAGVRASADSSQCSDSDLRDNGSFGAVVDSATDTLWDGNRLIDNAAGGMSLDNADAATLRDNRVVANVGNGITLHKAPSSQVSGNLCALNDDDGLHIEQSAGAAVTDNDLVDNHGYGIFLRRSDGADFDALPGVQEPPGSNRSGGNRKGDVFVRPD